MNAKLRLAMAVSLVPGFAAHADDGADLRRALAEIESLRVQNDALAAKVDRLEERVAADGEWLTERRAQEIRAIVGDVLGDASSRASLAADGATAGYDASKGAFVASADGSFRLGLKGDMQIRWAYSGRDIGTAAAAQGSPASTASDDSWGFELRRSRLALFGHVIDPSWSYELRLAFNRTATGSSNAAMEEAYFEKDFGGGVSLRAGQFKAPFLREELVPSTAQMAVERSAVNDLFSPSRAQGVRLAWEEQDFRIEGFFGDALRANGTGPYSITTAGIGPLNAGAALGVASSQNTGFNLNQSSYAFAARAEWKPLGEWRQFRDMRSLRGEEAGVLLGLGGYAQQVDAVTATDGASPDVLWSMTADASIDLGGANILVYGVYRSVSLHAAQPVRGGGSDDSLDQWGAVVQGGVFVTDDVELFARYEIGDSDTDRYRTQATALAASGGDLSLATVGVNWWPAGSRNTRIKWTTDVSYGFESLVDFSPSGADILPDYTASGGATSDGQWIVRSQLQFMF
ncbi:MAG: hypothetical protein GC172_08700 [Phycisphaera sp.]|nr:hypothetical protein [Phycisphaera sp.]